MDQKKKLTGKAHKKLAELHSKLGNASAAIRNLEALLSIAFEDNNKQGQAEAALKLGLLNYKEGLIPTSVNYLKKHFDLARHMGDGGLIDCARVNLGIAEAQQHVEKFKKLILTDVQELIKFQS
jgi:hypothetical protein